MRNPRDYDAELRTLEDKARTLKARKLVQLGELVVATGADGLDPEQLAGLLLSAGTTTDFVTKEEWRRRGADFFQDKRKAEGRAARELRQPQAHTSSAAPAAGEDRE